MIGLKNAQPCAQHMSATCATCAYSSSMAVIDTIARNILLEPKALIDFSFPFTFVFSLSHLRNSVLRSRRVLAIEIAERPDHERYRWGETM